MKLRNNGTVGELQSLLYINEIVRENNVIWSKDILGDVERHYNNIVSPINTIGEARKTIIRIFGIGKIDNDVQRKYEIMKIVMDSYENDTC
jgi:hypothetical protein